MPAMDINLKYRDMFSPVKVVADLDLAAMVQHKLPSNIQSATERAEILIYTPKGYTCK